MTGRDIEIEREAAVFCRYVVKAAPTPQMTRLYRDAVTRQQKETIASEADERLVRYAVQHPAAIGYLDGALALFRPGALLRQRLYIMFAITEATTEYAGRYLPVKRGYWYIIAVGLLGARAVFRALIGCGLLLLTKSKA